MQEVLVEPAEEVRIVKYEVQAGSLYRDFGSYEDARAYTLRLPATTCSIWRCLCYDDGYTTRYSRQLLVAFK